MGKSLQVKLLNILFFLITAYVNYLSVVFKIGGKSIRELSEKYDNLFTPSNRTFAIWSLIYLLVGIFLVMQFLGRYKNERITNNAYFAISCVLNFSWILCWQYEFIELSLIVMLGLLFTLARMNQQIRDSGRTFLKLVFGVYLGWICVATIANITALLVSLHMQIDLSNQVAVTILILVVSALLVAWVMYQLANPYLAIAVCWAYYGIYAKRMLDHPTIAYAALMMIIGVIISLWFVYRKMSYKGPIK